MQPFESADDVLDYAIDREDESIAYYQDLLKFPSANAIKKEIESTIVEERRHREKLKWVKSTGKFKVTKKKIIDLGISDFVEIKPVGSIDSLQGLLALAMHREKLSFKLYQSLSELASDEEIQGVFGLLAQEEAKHKLRFELEYDELVLQEN